MNAIRVFAGVVGVGLLTIVWGPAGLIVGAAIVGVALIWLTRSGRDHAAPVNTHAARQRIEEAERKAAWDEMNKRAKRADWQRGDWDGGDK